jgi:hypothetical protein
VRPLASMDKNAFTLIIFISRGCRVPLGWALLQRMKKMIPMDVIFIILRLYCIKLIRLRIWLSQRVDYKEGAPSFMEELCLCGITKYLPESHGANGLQAFHQKDVSTLPGCINRALWSTSRYAKKEAS